jgi:hypothetical protein
MEYHEATTNMIRAQQKKQERMASDAIEMQRVIEFNERQRKREEAYRQELHRMQIRREESDRDKRELLKAKIEECNDMVNNECEDEINYFAESRKINRPNWYKNSLYTWEMYLEDKKKSNKKNEDGYLCWKLSRWYELDPEFL